MNDFLQRLAYSRGFYAARAISSAVWASRE